MNNKKVLIVTYYWPPAGGPGVQRWLKFVKYLPGFGIEPIVYVPENPSYPIIDNSLSNEVPENLKIIKNKIWEPYQIAEFFNPKSGDYKAGHFEKPDKQSLMTRFSVFVRGNFFIPDARKFWVQPSVRFLNDYIKKHRIDTIITTGPPHSLHLIGLKLKNQMPDLKWLADFRDPWTQISYHKQLKLLQFSKNKHLELECAVIKTADCVIATSYTDGDNYRKIGAKRTEVITNGFEPSEFEKPNKQRSQSSKFRITYSGGLEIARNPVVVWQALNELAEESEEFKSNLELIFYGNLSAEVENSIKENGLSYCLKKNGYVSHSESIQGIVDSELLLLTNFPDENSKGIIPGKIFEYLATQNPVLAIGPVGGDVAIILNETASGAYFTHSEKHKIKGFIQEKYRNRLNTQTKERFIKKFSRESLTEKLAEIIKV